MEKPYANIQNPTIEASVNGLFRLETENQAKEKLDILREHFILSKQQIETEDNPSVILWIKGYDVSPEEKKKGYLGNFAAVSYKKTPNGKFTLYATKMEAEPKYHPQRIRQKSRHPNWGHPILRSIKKGRIFESVEDVQQELQTLHEEFPDISIPCLKKMYIMIYSKEHGQKSPVQKYVLEIKTRKEGDGFYIDYSANNYSPPIGAPVKKKTANAGGGEKAVETPKGYFSSMVRLKQAKRIDTPTGAKAGSGAASVESNKIDET